MSSGVASTIPLLEHLSKVPDPRASNRRYSLSAILAMAIVAVVCDCDTWEDIADYAVVKREWFSQFLDVPRSTPSADTFARVFSLLSPEALATGFADWTRSMAPHIPQWTPFDVVAVDGKTLRGSKWRGGPAAHLVSAWSSANGICMASLRTDSKSNDRGLSEGTESELSVTERRPISRRDTVGHSQGPGSPRAQGLLRHPGCHGQPEDTLPGRDPGLCRGGGNRGPAGPRACAHGGGRAPRHRERRPRPPGAQR